MSAQPTPRTSTGEKLNYLTATHCKAGHDLRDEGALYISNTGARHCAVCRRIRQNEDYHAVKEGLPRPQRRQRTPKQQCIRGHKFTEETTYIGGDGRRRCKACRAIYDSARYGKNPPLPSVHTTKQRNFIDYAQQQRLHAELYRLHDEREKYGKQHYRYEELTKRIRWLEGQVE